MDTQPIIIEPPVRGYWTIYNPPGHPAQAYDFLAVDEKKSLYKKGNFFRHLVSFIPVEDTRAWSSPVYSPVNGVVVECLDGKSDRQKISFIYDLFKLRTNKPKVSDGFGAFGGNYIMLQADNIFVLLCHLRNGSLLVKKGDKVTIGQRIGEVGNSGNSIQPHLHIQVMYNDKYFPLFENLLTFKLSDGKVKQHDNWVEQHDFGLSNRAHYLFDSSSSDKAH